MMKRMMIVFLSLLSLIFFTGCKTTEQETKPISWEQQQGYLSKTQDPRVYGMVIHDTPTGLQFRGGGRLHRGQVVALPMEATEPLRPVVHLVGGHGLEWPAAIDFTSEVNWMGYDTAMEMRARPVSEGKARLVKMPGDDIPACLSVTSSLRLGQLFVEYPLVFVRMATGSLGRLNRGVTEPPVKAVIGWRGASQMAYIRLQYSSGMIVLATTDEYEPNPEMLVAKLKLVKDAGACAVRGKVDGKEQLILVDPMGDFEVATDRGAAVALLELDDGPSIQNPTVVQSPGGVRIGAQMLQQYDLVICPKDGLVYVMSQPSVEE